MKALLRTSVAVCFVSLATWACSSGSGSAPAGGGGGAIPISELPGAYSAALCDNVGPCCQKAGLPHDAGKCKALFTALLGSIESSVNSGKAKYDANKAGSCVSQAKASVSSCSLDGLSSFCDGVFQGTVAAGGACTNDIECQAPAAGDATCDNGKCVVEARGKVGDTCKWTCTESGSITACGGAGGDTGAECFTNDGLYCDSKTQKCEAQIALGSMGCGFNDQACATGGYCDSDTCQPRKALGVACSNSDECVETAYCAASMCAEKKAPGAACDGFDECKEGFCQNKVCAGGDAGLTFLCQ